MREMMRFWILPQNGFVLVSKDEDFLHLSLTRRGRPQIVWVRLGNCRTKYLLSAFGKAMPALVAAITDGQTVVEIR
jgi:predicted nuclease of predicted toxin-antitoxin system